MAITDAFAGMGSVTFRILASFLPIIFIIIIIIVLIYLWIQRRTYRFPVSIISEREGGGTKERETRGAIIARRGSSPYFSLKTGFRSSKMLPKLPRLYGMTGSDRLYFYQKDPDTFIQLKRNLSEGLVDLEPVESDIKYGAILSIQRIRQLTQKQSMWDKYGNAITIGFGLMVLLIMFILLLNKFDPNIMLQISGVIRDASANNLEAAKAIASARC